MKLTDMVKVLDTELDISAFVSADASLNGLQVGASAGKTVRKVAVAVDAALATFEAAAAWGADILIVHHGLFWGRPLAITGTHYERIKLLLEKDMALYACHLPLDAHPVLGNNACIARALGLMAVVPFGIYKGIPIGFKGVLPSSLTAQEIAGALGYGPDSGLRILPYGPEKINSIGIISGGGADDVQYAIDQGLDAFLTGEPLHQVHHDCRENKVTMICGGHYATETLGVQAVGQYLSVRHGCEVRFIDIPTGL